MTGFTDLQDVLVHAPFRNDARMLTSLLHSREMRAAACSGEEEFASLLAGTLPGALVVTQEALTDRVVGLIRDHLATQPEWSELSVIVLVEKGASQANLPRVLAEAWPGSRQIFYERPLATIELVSGIQSALLARLRQRDVRDHIVLERELRHELNHRVKNILASVNSIFQMTARGSRNLDELKQSFGGRLRTLGDVHAALFETGGDLLDLEELVSLVLAPYTADGGTSFRASGPPVALGKDATSALGLVIHELATNAIKYGAWSVPAGRIDVTWEVADGAFRLCWSESGGPAVSAPARTGYGTRYVRAALQGLFGEEPQVTFARAGLEMNVGGPLERIQPNPADRSASEPVGTVS